MLHSSSSMCVEPELYRNPCSSDPSTWIIFGYYIIQRTMTSPNTAAAHHLTRLSTSSATRSSPRNVGRDASNVRFTASTKSVSCTGSSKSQMTQHAQTPTSLLHRSLRSGSHGSISSLSQSTKPSSGKKRPPPRKNNTRGNKRTKRTSQPRHTTADDTTDDDEDKDADADDDKDSNGERHARNEPDFFNTTSGSNDTPIPEDEDNPLLREMIDKHRRLFMSRAFPPIPVDGDNEDDADRGLWCRPQQELDYIVFVLSNWQTNVNLKTMSAGPEKDKLTKFRREHKGGNKFKKKYHLETIQVPGDEPRTVLRRLKKNARTGRLEFGRIVLSRESVFQAIDEWHRVSGHLGQERTWNFCKEKFYNCGQRLVAIYCELCVSCMHKNPVTKPQRGSRRPILSRYFRLRFQIDLIDFRKLRKRDPFGVMMRWILTVKDHATGFVFICALPRKRARLVAYKLQEYFGTIGYPIIFHTDNGKEFTAKVILRFLRQLNPNIITVTGRPRRPNDQGSVESMNKLVKRVLNSTLVERRLVGENPNWTEVLGSVAATINSASGRGRNDVPAYTAVYGQTYDHDISCSKEEARRCWSLPERLRVSQFSILCVCS